MDAIVNCKVLNLLLIPIFNALGASIATVTAELSVTIIQIWFV
ncbi:MAG: polysaccharide biosynthesis C-terminal domain-containing protein [Enterocloster sp.]